MSHEARLHSKLKPRTRERRTYESVKSKAEDIVSFFPAHARYYTDHGKEHSKRIIENLDAMLTEGVIRRLNRMEVLVLLCSAWLHDIGYVVDEKERRRLSDQEIQDSHHKLSEYIVMKHYPILGLEDESTASLVGRICACHRRGEIIEEKLPREREGLKGATIASQFLAALLSLADALDTDTRRAPEIRSHYVSQLPQVGSPAP